MIFLVILLIGALFSMRLAADIFLDCFEALQDRFQSIFDPIWNQKKATLDPEQTTRQL